MFRGSLALVWRSWLEIDGCLWQGFLIHGFDELLQPLFRRAALAAN
jgi:hypothetical protein